MRLIDLDQTIFVSIVDETHDGASYEMQMTVGEFFDKFCEGFKPDVIDAVSVEWLEEHDGEDICYLDTDGNAYARRTWSNHEWVEDAAFEDKVKAACENRTDGYVVFIDIHD